MSEKRSAGEQIQGLWDVIRGRSKVDEGAAIVPVNQSPPPPPESGPDVDIHVDVDVNERP